MHCTGGRKLSGISLIDNLAGSVLRPNGSVFMNIFPANNILTLEISRAELGELVTDQMYFSDAYDGKYQSFGWSEQSRYLF